MKKSLFNSLLWLVITIFLFTIAFPTLIINYNNATYRVEGWDPSDVNPSFIFPEFRFLPALDLQGGNIATLKVDLSSVEESQRDIKLNEIKNIIFLRLLKTNPGYFELHSSVNKENGEYNLLLKLPEKINESFLNLLITPANLMFWVEDSEMAGKVSEEEAQQNILAGRKMSNLTNSDIESVSVVSDARCYFNDAAAPRNFCIKVIFKPESKTEFLEALYASPTGQTPLLLVIDGVPIAVQAMGQFYSGVTPDRELLLYPGITDEWVATAVLAAIVSDTPIESSVSLTSVNTVEPLLGLNTLSYLKLSLISAVFAVCLLLAVYFRKRSLLAIAGLLLFLIYDIALMKVFNLVLDLPLIAGFLASLLLFLSFIIYMLYRIRTASKSGLEAEELESALEVVSKHYRNLTLIVVIGAFIISVFAPLFVISFYNGMGFGVIVGLILLAFPVKHLASLILLKGEKWYII